MLNIKFGFDWPTSFRGDDVWIFFSESLIFSPTAHFLQDFHFKWHFKSFPYSNALATYVDLAVKKRSRSSQGHDLYTHCSAWAINASCQVSLKSVHRFWRRRFFKGFYHIWAWRPSWSCDLDFLYTHWFPLPINASYRIWLWLAKRFQRRRSLKLWTDRRRTDAGSWPSYKLTLWA